MNYQRAFELVESLREGADPFTGELLPANSLLQQPEMVRALFAAAHALQEQLRQNARAARIALAFPNAGKPWQAREDEELVTAFDAGLNEKQLAAQHRRSLGAIRARLIKLGRLEPLRD